ncbi:MAG TPA: hypothetical protein VGP73_23370, partial [Thermoanaerobaculia bacterium]
LVDLVNELGHPVETLPLDRWAAELAAFAEGDGRELLAPLAGFLRRLDAGGPPLWRPLRFDSTRTREALAAGPVACPAVDRRLVESYLASLAEAGRIPPADRAELRRSVR